MTIFNSSIECVTFAMHAWQLTWYWSKLFIILVVDGWIYIVSMDVVVVSRYYKQHSRPTASKRFSFRWFQNFRSQVCRGRSISNLTSISLLLPSPKHPVCMHCCYTWRKHKTSVCIISPSWHCLSSCTTVRVLVSSARCLLLTISFSFVTAQEGTYTQCWVGAHFYVFV